MPKDPNKEPISTKALVNNGILQDVIQLPQKIVYTYTPPLNNYDQEVVDITTLLESEKRWFESACAKWQSVAKVIFIQQPTLGSQVVPIYRATLKSQHMNFHTGGVTKKDNLSPFFDPTTQKTGLTYKNRSIRFHQGMLDKLNEINHVGNLTHIFTHEIGHLLGLEHPFRQEADYKLAILPTNEHTTHFSIMNYKHSDEDEVVVYPMTPMPYDIRAVQTIYGSNMNTYAGDTIYDLTAYIPNTSEYKTISAIWDANGIDTLTAAGYTGDVVIDLQEGSYHPSRIGNGVVLLAYGANIENVIGSFGKNIIYLNNLNNEIDISNSTQSIIYTQLNGGKDVIKGFVPSRDKIVIESEAVVNSVIEPSGDNDCIIKFDEKNYLTIYGVMPSQLSLHGNTINNVKTTSNEFAHINNPDFYISTNSTVNQTVPAEIIEQYCCDDIVPRYANEFFAPAKTTVLKVKLSAEKQTTDSNFASSLGVTFENFAARSALAHIMPVICKKILQRTNCPNWIVWLVEQGVTYISLLLSTNSCVPYAIGMMAGNVLSKIGVGDKWRSTLCKAISLIAADIQMITTPTSLTIYLAEALAGSYVGTKAAEDTVDNIEAIVDYYLNKINSVNLTTSSNNLYQTQFRI